MATKRELDLMAIRTMVDELLAEIAPRAIVRESLDWYLKNNFEDFKAALNRAETGKDIDTATSVLSRFCTESMDWNSDLYRKCTEITAIGFRLAKEWSGPLSS